MRRTGWIELARNGVLALAGALLLAAPAFADQWNDKTKLSFSEAVMVPGATLQPGTYTFKLLNPETGRHTVQIVDADGEPIVVAHAVPMKRNEPSGDVVAKFSATDAGKPLALRGWYYPGSLYGHEFVYSDEEARAISERTKTVVLAVDLKGSDAEAGRIHVYHPSGQTAEWHGDNDVLREWDEWRLSLSRTAGAGEQEVDRSTDKDERRAATAPMIEADRQGQRVKFDDLDDNPNRYIGRTISVDAEVDDVLGPRLFTIEAPGWSLLGGELLVHVPAGHAALVREDDRVTVTGTVKTFVRDDLEAEWGWPGGSTDIDLERAARPVLVASRVVGGNDDVALVINTKAAGTGMDTRGSADRPVGTSGRSGSSVARLADIESGDAGMVGRLVTLTDARVHSMGDSGFFVMGERRAIFVLPAKPAAAEVKAGDAVTIDGYVLQMPGGAGDRLNAPEEANGAIYVFATKVERK